MVGLVEAFVVLWHLLNLDQTLLLNLPEWTCKDVLRGTTLTEVTQL